MKLKHTITALAVTTLASNAAITTMLAANGFTNYNLGSDIHNGTTFSGDFSSVDATGVLTGDSLAVTPLANGWVQQDNGTSDFESAIGTGDWTVETTITLTGTKGIALWIDPSTGATGGLLYIGTNGLGTGAATNGSNANLDTNSNVGTHSFRMAYDSAASAISVWRDGALVTDTFTPSNPGGGPRLILGDCCSSLAGGNTFTIEAFSYDTSGAFAPIPEPSSVTLLVLSGLALLRRRRK